MPARTDRKHTQVIDNVEDQTGADIANDLLRTGLFGRTEDTWAEIEVNAAGELVTTLGGPIEGEDVEHLRTAVYGEDPAGDLIKLALDEAGQLDVTLEAESVSLEGEDAGGVVQDVNADALQNALAGTDIGLATWSARALESLGVDEVRSRLHDSAGTQIDPATTALEDALQANAADEFRVRVAGEDGVQVAEEALDTGVAAADVGLLTYLARALNSVGQDHLVVQENGAIDVSAATVSVQEATALDVSAATVPVEQQTPVGIEDTGGVQIDPATGALENALQANAADEFRARVHDSAGAQLDPLNQDSLQTVGDDELRARLFGPDAGGVLQQVIAEQLDTAVAATDVGLLTWEARALNTVGQDELVARVTDATGSQVDVKDSDAAFEDTTALAANGEVTNRLVAQGGQSVNGRVVSTGSYDVEARWQDDTGTTLFTETVAAGVAADTETDLDLTPQSSHVEIAVVDQSGADQNVDEVLHYN